ncbi:MAG: hypothetical protein ORN29_05145, partial [Rhodoferax sp.]|nr:hypothetical protein [Rhodoferax sp.]
MKNPSTPASAVNCLPPAPKRSAELRGMAAPFTPPTAPVPVPVPVYKVKVARKAVREVRLQDADLVLVLDGNDTFLIKGGARKYAAHKPFSLQFTDGKVAAGKFIDAHPNVLYGKAQGNGNGNSDSDSSSAIALVEGPQPGTTGATVMDGVASSSKALVTPVAASTVGSSAIPGVVGDSGNMASPAATTPPLAAVAAIADASPVAAAPPQATASGDKHWGLLGIVAALGLA